MKEKKDIDKVFKDGLNNLGASPSPRVWENIQAQLNKDKTNRKVIPLWIRIGGIAALLALLFTVGNWVFNPLDFGSPAITNENTNQTEREFQEKTRGDQQSKEIQIVSGEKNDGTDEVNPTESVQKQKSAAPRNGTDSFDNGAIVSSEKSIETNIASERVNSETAHKSKEAFNRNNKSQEGIATSEISSKVIPSERKGNDISPDGIKTDDDIPHKTPFDSKSEDAIAKQNLKKVEVEEKQDSETKPSILDAIAQQESLKEEKKKKETLEQRWSVTPNLAPVYYSSLGNGSSIDPEFADNSQKGDVNMSYGVQVSYALNNRLSVRTGLNNVDLSYSTSDILIGTGPPSVGLRGVDYGDKQLVVTAINRSTLNSTAPTNGHGELNLKSTSGDARLIQNISYYEVPLELQYAVIDSRFGVNLIGGVSTLFLGNNEISVKADNFSSVLGSANNLSSVSFSTNVGLGLNYKLSKRFIFNVEPMFKYQLNPYSDSSVDFKPYYLGVYSGLSFKF